MEFSIFRLPSPAFLRFFSYEATVSLAKPINRAVYDVSFAEFSYGKRSVVTPLFIGFARYAVAS